MSTATEATIRARQRHHCALELMLPMGSTATGLQTWRKLRRLESLAHRTAEDYCNGLINSEQQEAIAETVTRGVFHIFGQVPKGFFINWDPRGYALKLEPSSVPYPLHEDWGRYQILAPAID